MDYKHARDLIALREKRLRILELREATFGPLHVPPEVVIEIDQLREELARLRAQLQREAIRDHLLEEEQPPPHPGLIVLIGPGRIDQDPLNQSALAAIEYHRQQARLRHCWLIGSGGDERGSLPMAVEFGRICEAQGVTAHVWSVTNPFSIQETHDVVDRIYAYEVGPSGLEEREVIADLTGATKPMSIGMLLASRGRRPVQYMVRVKQGQSQPILLRFPTSPAGGE